MLELNALSFTHQHTKVCQLDNISLRTDDGEAIALLGADGSGKTTLLQVLAGIAPGLIKGQRQGTVSVAGCDPVVANAPVRLRSVGLVLADPFAQLSGVVETVEEEIAWGLSNLGVPRAEMHSRTEAIMRRLEIQHLRHRHPWSLSCGQQQLVAIASVLVLGAKVLLLDEPGSRLDGQSRRRLEKITLEMAAQGHTVIWATSKISEAVSFPRWVYIENGTIAYDGPPCLQECGVLEAPWTQLARQARTKDLWKGDLPLTMEEAAAAWRR